MKTKSVGSNFDTAKKNKNVYNKTKNIVSDYKTWKKLFCYFFYCSEVLKQWQALKKVIDTMFRNEDVFSTLVISNITENKNIIVWIVLCIGKN